MNSLADDNSSAKKPWESGNELSADSPHIRKLQKLAGHIDRSYQLHETGSIKADSYLQTHFAQLALPYRDPKGATHWTRVNGGTKLVLEPGLVSDSKGNLAPKFPFGVVPRLFLIWLTSEVKISKSKELELGDSLQEFMLKIGLGTDGSNQRRRVMDQLRRLLAARISIRESVNLKSEQVWRDSSRQMQLADSWDLWFSARDVDGQEPLMGSRIELSQPFYEAIQQSAVPLSTGVLREIQSNAMQLDIYTWLVHRLFNLRSTSNISWQQLHGQFGGSYKRMRDFRRDFVNNLSVVRAYYPTARVYDTTDGLILKPSGPHIARRGKKKSQSSAGDIISALSSDKP